MILVTGATGNVGRHVVAELLAGGVPAARVRAMCRSPESAGPPAGVRLVRGSLADPRSLDAALDGVESVFLVWPTMTADHAAPATLEAIAKRARRIVYLSSRGVPDDPAVRAEWILGSHQYIEELIERSGVEWTFLRPSGFATNTLAWAPEIRAGDVVRWVYGDAGRSLIHERDIAAVGARALTGDGHHAAKYLLTGPETLTQVEQVRIIGEAIGRPLRFEEIEPAAAHRRFAKYGMPDPLVGVIFEAHRAMVAEPEPVTGTVEALTGRPARTFREWAADHVADFT